MSAQNTDTLIFCDYKIIPLNYRTGNTVAGEFSGIEYAGEPGKYFILPQCDSLPHYYLFDIKMRKNQICWTIDSIIYINAKSFDGESIRRNPVTGEIFLTEELKRISYLKKINKSGKPETVTASDGMQKFNRGWEGSAFSPDGKYMFISLERSRDKTATHILKYNMQTGQSDTLKYNLDLLPNDTYLDNGITEILCINDSSLLVCERAWQKSINHTSVRIYKALINTNTNKIAKKLIFDFDNLYFNVDNVEGMTFNADRSKIIFVTDNNNNKHQQTQIICFKTN